jgi:hypothetical protein
MRGNSVRREQRTRMDPRGPTPAARPGRTRQFDPPGPVTPCRQLDRERSELGASKAVVSGGAHGQLLMGELTSEQRVTVG